MQVERNRAVANVVAAYSGVKQARGELPILGAPAIEALVVPVHAQRVLAPERLVATLDAAQAVLDARCHTTGDPAAPRIQAALQAGRPPAQRQLLAVQEPSGNVGAQL